MEKELFVEKEFVDNGLNCSVVLTRLGHRCGYVAVDEAHPLFGKSDEDEEVYELPAYGGVTYAGEFPTEQEELKSLWAFGFDCAHVGDAPDVEAAMAAFGDITFPEALSLTMRTGNGVVRTQAFVEDECRQLAEALVLMARKIKEKTFVCKGEMAKSRLYGGERWSFSVIFDDGMEMEVGVQGMDEDPAIPYAQLYDQKGRSVGYTNKRMEWKDEYNDMDPYDLIGPSIHRDWVLEHDGIMYIVHVPEDGEGDVFEEHEYEVLLPPSSKRW